MGLIFEDGRENPTKKSKLVRVSAALDPRNIASLDADTLQTMFGTIVGIMHS